jgi:peptidoglycan/xylan/chitin deacetylase (PgdA/CDA1 family)
MGGPPAAVVGVDFEDWHQIVQRRLGYERWDRPRESFERQLQGVLSVFDEIGARVTFFLVGMTARHYPRLVEDAVARGHEIACHGYSHVPAWTQTPEEFRDDLLRSLDAIERLSGSRPVGYRAPIFSLDRRTPSAWEIMAEAGLLYDASLHDTPRIPCAWGTFRTVRRPPALGASYSGWGWDVLAGRAAPAHREGVARPRGLRWSSDALLPSL